MVKNILIRNLTVDDNRMLQEIKRETGHQQASRALLRTGHDYLRLLETSGLQREKIDILEEENKKLRQSSVAILKAVEDIESVIKNNI